MNTRRWIVAAFPLLAIAAFMIAGCGGGGSSGGESNDDLTDLVLVDVSVGGVDGVALNQIIRFEFSEEIVSSSVSPETIRIRLSPFNAKQVGGEFNISGNIIEFFPTLPVSPDLSDAGLVPSQTYQIHLPGSGNTNTLENADGDALAKTYKVSFATASASSPNLFIDYDPPPTTPRVISVNPRDEAVNVPQSVIPELTFSEPLHPSTVTTGNITLTMTHRPPVDPANPLLNKLSPERPILGHLIFEQNRQSVTLKFVSDFPLADNATYRIEVDRRVSDLSRNDLEPFMSTFSIRDEPPVPGFYMLDFDTASEKFEDLDVTIASWNKDIPGMLSAIFTAGAGDGTDGDFEPTGNTTLNSNSQSVYNFRVFTVKAGVTVSLTGDKPITILSLAKMEIAGVVKASGSDGGKGETATYNTAVPRNYGGKGGPGGGDGGDAMTTSGKGTSPGEDGYNTEGTGAGAVGWPTSYLTYVIALTGGSGGGHRTAGTAGKKGAYTYYGNASAGLPGQPDGNKYINPLTGGGGGSAGQMALQSTYTRNGAGSGGGAGGGVELRSANNIEILGGKILAKGGAGGAPGSTYMASPGGGGAGGAILIRTLSDIIAVGATIDAEGGKGHTSGFYTYYCGASGDGGHGWVRLDDSDGTPSLASSKINPSTYTSGTFTASGAGAPSIGQTLWMNMGVYDPRFLSSEVEYVIPKAGQTISVQIQAAPEDIFDFGMPDEDQASAWTDLADLTSLNGKGHSFVRLRVTFTLAADQELDDPVPYVDSIKILYEF